MNKINVLLLEDCPNDKNAFINFIQDHTLKFDCTIASTVKKALELLDTASFDIVLTDYLLADGTAFDILPLPDNIPFIFVTASGNEEIAVHALKFGAYYYLPKDKEEKYLLKLPVIIDNAIEYREIIEQSNQKKKQISRYQHELEDLVQLRTQELTTLNKQLQREIKDREKAEEELYESLSLIKNMVDGTVQTIIAISEMRDPYTAGHQKRVSQLSYEIANQMKLPKHKREGCRMAALLHDVGKIYVPTEILSKPGAISEMEFNIIKYHSQAGYDLLKLIDFPWPIADIVLQHHEKMDGSGYPRGIKGKDISIEAKIISVADTVEAMTFHRPYRPGRGLNSALNEIINKKTTKFDPEIVDICVHLFRNKNFEFSTG